MELIRSVVETHLYSLWLDSKLPSLFVSESEFDRFLGVVCDNIRIVLDVRYASASSTDKGCCLCVEALPDAEGPIRAAVQEVWQQLMGDEDFSKDYLSRRGLVVACKWRKNQQQAEALVE